MKRLSRFFAALVGAAVVLPSFGGMHVDAAGQLPINEANFPDPNFRAYIAQAFDTDKNGYLSDNEIFLIWNVHCENMNIYSVKGIEHFPYLKGLWCKGNNITEFDLSGNPDLHGIWCSFNKFESLDFSDCPNLEWVYCFNCDLKELNVRNNPKLAYLECNANPELKTLDLSQNPQLENLFCSSCGLETLDLSNNPLLCELAAFKNKLKTIDVSKNTLLKRLDIWDNPNLGNVDISNLSGLEYYNCAKTKVTQLDVSHNPELTELVASYNNGLKKLDLSHNPKLAFLNVECDQYLQGLDLSHNPRMFHLYAFGMTSIDVIDISKNSRLCKAYNEGVYVHETENLGYVYSKTIDYGGSGDPFDDLQHIVVFDDRAKIIGKYNGTNDVPDSVLDSNDYHSDSEQFATRAQTMQFMYEKAGSPEVTGTSRFTDVDPNAPYAKAVKWGEDNKICFGFPNISSDTFCPDQLITRQDFGLMTHRYADKLGFGTAFDYGRTDWFEDFFDIDFYCWGAFTWAVQWRVVPIPKDDNHCYPRGRLTVDEMKKGVDEVFDLDEGASYSDRVGGNDGATPKPGQPTTAPGQPTTAPGQPTTAPGQPTTAPGQPTPPVTIVKMPDVVGMQYEAAKKEVEDKLREGGFNHAITFNIVWADNSDPEKAGKVVLTDPEAGANIFSSNDILVTLFVAEQGAGTTPAPGDPDKEPSIADFVERLYTIALNRASEPEGKAFWVKEIEDGNRTGGDCAYFFLIEAPEFKNRGLGDEDFVETLYKTFFDRASEADGKAFWVGQLKNKTMTRDQVIMGFIDSKEWCNVCATYGVKSGAPTAKAEIASKNAIAFATRLYTCCLGRAAEEGGLKYWSLALTNLEQTGCSAAKEFFTTPEFVNLKLKDDEYVTRLYKTFMDREPQAGEVTYWTGEIAKGSQTRESVLAFFGQSEEFTNICKKYGIDRGTI
ncbi:MAG: DUF4214 domain-containing protein [Clostridiales bacterium]|nr:DUF4214 domain-containing protein [Clostridiales bacterium]